jgi:hypothetical protein
MKKISFTKNTAPANRIDSMFSFHTCLELLSPPRNGPELIPCVCLYFCSTEWNSELFSLPRNGSEGNSERLLILFHGKEFQAFFSSAERFGTEFQEFSVS